MEHRATFRSLTALSLGVVLTSGFLAADRASAEKGFQPDYERAAKPPSLKPMPRVPHGFPAAGWTGDEDRFLTKTQEQITRVIIKPLNCRYWSIAPSR